jgi:hypothetical protein
MLFAVIKHVYQQKQQCAAPNSVVSNIGAGCICTSLKHHTCPLMQLTLLLLPWLLLLLPAAVF